MYQATIYSDSPALTWCRNLLAKQRLQWEETPTTVNRLSVDYSTGVRAEYTEFVAAVQIIVADTKAIVKAVRAKSKPRLKKPVKGYDCAWLPDGRWLWTSWQTGKQHTASFKYDAKLQAKIEAETSARINRQLRAPLSGSVNFKGELFL